MHKEQCLRKPKGAAGISETIVDQNEGEMDEEQCPRAPKRVAGISETMTDPSKLETETNETLRIDVRKLVVDRVY